MSTLITTNLKHPSSSSNNLVLNADGSVDGAGGGKILQVKSTTKKDKQSHSGTTHTLISGLTVSITPASSSNKILLVYNVSMGSTGAAYVELRIARGSLDDINIGDADGSNTRCTHYRYFDNYYGTTDYSSVDTYPFAGNYLDSPNTTSAITYGIYFANPAGSYGMIINSTSTTNWAGYGTSTSTLTAMEVSA